MNKIITSSIAIGMLLGFSGCVKNDVSTATVTMNKGMNVKFANSQWDGKTVPKDQVCRWAGGDGSTPELKISNIPDGANTIIVEFSDRTYKPMDKGGHGQIGFTLSKNHTTAMIPAIRGETKTMPSNMFIHKEHKGLKRGSAGSYLPPCSGGKGNSYYATVKAVNKNGTEIKVLGTSTIEMGKF